MYGLNIYVTLFLLFFVCFLMFKIIVSIVFVAVGFIRLWNNQRLLSLRANVFRACPPYRDAPVRQSDVFRRCEERCLRRGNLILFIILVAEQSLFLY